MPRWLLVLGTISSWAVRAAFIAGVPAWAYKLWTDIVNGVDPGVAVAVAFVGIAATIFLAIAVSQGINYFLDHSKFAEIGNRVAHVLMGLRLAGNSTTFAKEVVNIWYDEQPSNAILRLATKEGLYAKLREAVRRGWIGCPNFPAHEVRADFQMDLTDSIEFFRRRRWLEIEADDQRHG
jgi:hypothetical protein